MLMKKCDVCGRLEPGRTDSSWRNLNYDYMSGCSGDGHDRDGFGLFRNKDLCRFCHEKISEAIRKAIKEIEDGKKLKATE